MDLKRSWMFVPGHRQKMIDKALGLNADAIMLDIEDGVAPSEKDTARQLIGEALGRSKGAELAGALCAHQCHRPSAHGYRPRRGSSAWVEGLVLPKVETAEEVMKLDAILTQREAKQRMPGGSVRLLIAIESPRGLLNAPAIAGRSSRVCGLMFGAKISAASWDCRHPARAKPATCFTPAPPW